MKFGADFNKIEWNIGGWNLLEPNAFLGDSILALLGIYIAVQIYRKFSKSAFNNLWRYFFLVNSINVFCGGLGHLLWNYWGVSGKYIPWFTLIITALLVELAMISLEPLTKVKTKLQRFVFLKFLLVLTIEIIVVSWVDLDKNVNFGIFAPLISAWLGSIFALGLLTYNYNRRFGWKFGYFQSSILLGIPIPFFHGLKINFAQWFDRNDMNHLLLAISLILFYQGIRVHNKWNVNNQPSDLPIAS